jgi:hypothetical protein
MNWINLNVTVLDSEEFLGADPTERGTWLCLMRYCCGQENGGKIEGAKAWKDRKWQQVVRVTLKEVQASCDLWRWEGDDLIIGFYPEEKEAEVRHKRENAKTNGARGGRPKKTNVDPPEGTNVGLLEKPMLVNSAKAEGEGEGEGNEKGKELPPKSPKGDGEGKSPDLFVLVSLYPRREGQAQAIANLKRHLDAGTDPGAVAAGTRAIAAVIQQLPGGALNSRVLSAERFFRERRWEDDPMTWLRNMNGNGAPPGDLDLGGREEGNTTEI